jgi:protein-disulfide isomerase
MKIEFLYSESSCSHCCRNYQDLVAILEDYPYKESFIKYELLNLDYPKLYELASKHGILTTPMIIVNDNVVARKFLSKRKVLKILDKLKENKCKAVEQEQILLY